MELHRRRKEKFYILMKEKKDKYNDIDPQKVSSR